MSFVRPQFYDHRDGSNMCNFNSFGVPHDLALILDSLPEISTRWLRRPSRLFCFRHINNRKTASAWTIGAQNHITRRLISGFVDPVRPVDCTDIQVEQYNDQICTQVKYPTSSIPLYGRVQRSRVGPCSPLVHWVEKVLHVSIIT